jgi:hypothetical protein
LQYDDELRLLMGQREHVHLSRSDVGLGISWFHGFYVQRSCGWHFWGLGRGAEDDDE